ncbi:deoxyribodipyrimidine photo-lyase [Maridesulfovibrio bastinii]|uniref:deoxyribodipyrimidine photo-lyase n=1 Tax=Maridesulfovibrio bastinii TaxID=47157 RepID=UPI0003FE3474|nr:deoxyribodipyrimidine photo-lyase [Maridesulfovibrio bastinii]
MEKVNSERVCQLGFGPEGNGPVVYWMCRDQRLEDNWALLYAREEALKKRVPLEIVFCLAPRFLSAGARQYHFMLSGLKELEEKARNLNIGFRVLCGEPDKKIADYCLEQSCSTLIVDFFPLRIFNNWVKSLCSEFNGSIYEVDAHNIVPCRVASPKQEYAARTIRPKIHKRLPEFLEDYPKLEHYPYPPEEAAKNDWDEIYRYAGIYGTEPSIDLIQPGCDAACERLEKFLSSGIKIYDKGRNDPNEDAQSGLSPYLHFGQISSQRVAYEAARCKNPGEGNVEAFIEELVVRRELTDNFCFYNSWYDSFEGVAEWARKTLDDHRQDKRVYVYDTEAFENASTHSELWNAAQTELLKTGKMHGYMRMYWAKKILEWSESPEKALETAVYLNDRYSLDGRDPNGYVGILWSLGGLHDRGWTEREIYGKIRYMNERGCRRKFSVDKYIMTWLGMKLG